MVNETSMRIHDFCMKNTHCNTYAIYSLDTRCVLGAARWLGPSENGRPVSKQVYIVTPPPPPEVIARSRSSSS